MRIKTDRREIEVRSGTTTTIAVSVFNNDAVIDGISARLIGLPAECVKVQPALLSLFPDGSGTLNLAVAVPDNLAAGRHGVTIEVVSHGAHAPTQYLDLDLLVAPNPRLKISSRPRIARGKRNGRFVLDVVNAGNLRLAAHLDAVNVDRAMELRFSQQAMVLEPGGRAAVMLSVHGPRMVVGSELDRPLEVHLTGERLDLGPDTVEDREAPPIGDTSVLTFRQRPLVPRGMMTALILAGIVGMWAGAFLLGISKVFTSEPLTKQAPASFFVLTKLSQNGTVSTGYDAATAAPLGALPKNGQLPAGEGAQISGTVIAASDHQPVGRILVQAIRISNGTPIVVSSAGSQADGTYSLAGLFPTSYYLKFSAEGFRTIWYPASPTLKGAAIVATDPQITVPVKPVTITGEVASIAGSIDPGDALTHVVTTVTARSLLGGSPSAAAAVTHTDAGNRYTLRNLPAPGSYEVTFTAKGYESSAIVDSVTGGEQRLEAAVVLSAGEGEISGFVRDVHGEVGGATVSAVVNGTTIKVITPTSGRVGFYTLSHLPTPATYVVNFSAPGHGTVARIVDLGAGDLAFKPNFNTTLVEGTGSVTGSVTDLKGTGLGNVTITVGGVSSAQAVAAPSTRTLSAGTTGTFAVNGLAAPGSYTLTAQLDGYRSATVPFELKGDQPPPKITIHLSRGGGDLQGHITGKCPQQYCAGATVTATDGLHVYTTAASAPGGNLPSGGYLFTGLPAGTYSITASLDGMKQQTAIVTVREERTTKQSLRLGS